MQLCCCIPARLWELLRGEEPRKTPVINRDAPRREFIYTLYNQFHPIQKHGAYRVLLQRKTSSKRTDLCSVVATSTDAVCGLDWNQGAKAAGAQECPSMNPQYAILDQDIKNNLFPQLPVQSLAGCCRTEGCSVAVNAQLSTPPLGPPRELIIPSADSAK